MVVGLDCKCSTKALSAYDPATDYYGSDSFTYRVFDGEMYSELATVSITITPINDAPSLTELEPQVMDEDSGELMLPLSATDVDNSELVFSATSDNEAVTVSIESGIQHATVGITIGNIIMNQEAGLSPLSLPSGVYGILMYLVCLPFVLLYLRQKR